MSVYQASEMVKQQQQQQQQQQHQSLVVDEIKGLKSPTTNIFSGKGVDCVVCKLELVAGNK